MNYRDPRSVPSDDRGLLLGDGLFETVRLYAGVPFRLEDHLARLEAGARVLGIPLPADLEVRVRRGTESWGREEGVLRLTLTRSRGRGLSVPPDAGSRLLVSVSPWRGDPRPCERGLRARALGRVDEGALTAGLKTIGFGERIQALRLARTGGAEEALVGNTRDRLVGGSASNLFAVRGGILLAPGPEEGALPGVTRGILLELAGDEGIPVEPRGIEREGLGRVSELFLSSSLREVVPVVEVDGAPIGGGHPGSIFRRLSGRFRQRVALETGGEGRPEPTG